jgi:hypothetical protein
MPEPIDDLPIEGMARVVLIVLGLIALGLVLVSFLPRPA